MTASNPLCKCHKSGAWRTREDAEAALIRIQADPEPRMYTPTHVTSCARGVWHLTSKQQKRWRSGKNNARNDRRAYRREYR